MREILFKAKRKQRKSRYNDRLVMKKKIYIKTKYLCLIITIHRICENTVCEIQRICERSFKDL